MSAFFLFHVPKWLSLCLDVFILLKVMEHIYQMKVPSISWIKYPALTLVFVFLIDSRLVQNPAPNVFLYIFVMMAAGTAFSLFLKGDMSCKLLTAALTACMFAETTLLSFSVFYLYTSRTPASYWPYAVTAKALQLLLVWMVCKNPIRSEYNLPCSYRVTMSLSVSLTILFKWMMHQTHFLPMHPALFALYTLIYLTFSRLSQNYGRRIQLQLHNKQLSLQLEGWADIEEAYQELRKLRHDMKSHMVYMQSLLKAGDYDQLTTYLDSVGNQHSLSKTIVYAGIPVVDAVLTAKCTQCSLLNIPIEVKVMLPRELGVADHDFCCILSNLVDNAIEASSLTNDPHVSIVLFEKKGLLCLEISNRCKENVLLRNPRFKTTKADASEHGLGVSIVQEIAGRYRGRLSYHYKDGYVVAKVLLPRQKKPQEIGGEVVLSTTSA